MIVTYILLKAKKCLILGLLLAATAIFSCADAQNQDLQLAEEYYLQNEYEKARELYDKLARSGANLPVIYKNYLQSLLMLKDFKEAEKLVRRRIKNEPSQAIYRIDLGWVLEKQGSPSKGEEEFEEVVNEFKKQEEQVKLAAAHFINLEKIDWAEKILLTGRKAAGKKSAFAGELAEVYEIEGKKPAMIEEYLNFVLEDEENLEFVKNALQDKLAKQEDFDLFEKTLLTRVQSEPNQIVYNEMLLWLYLQQKRFYKAFVQAKALDKRYKLDGSELLSIGLIALKNQDYKTSKSVFEYVIQTYPKGANYPLARNYYIKSKEEFVKSTFPVNLEEIHSLIGDYHNLISELGKNYKTFEAMRSMAQLYAFYLNKKDTAVVILNDAIQVSQGRLDYIANCKTDMGDIYLLKNEPWEATLLYSQVEKLKKDHPIGYEAKLRNAKLSYFKGDFELAQSHLDILKEATSREIANDAMNLSLLIQDNLAFDTTGAALKEYSVIELMRFQNKDQEALQSLEQMLTKYAGNSILSEVLWSKAHLLIKMGQFNEAAQVLDKIVKEYGEGILGDDAYFLLGKLYEENLDNKEKAQEIYKDHLVKYPGSIFSAEARKRFRILRGDFVN